MGLASAKSVVYLQKQLVNLYSMGAGFTRNLVIFVLIVSVIIYLCFGALIFSAIENDYEAAEVIKLRNLRQSFMSKNQCVKDEDLENLIVEIVRASNKGVLPTRNCTNQPNWSFAQSLFFSTTVVTTIGYGHVTPLSRSGKIFCIAYATCGIPLTLVLMSALVERLLKPSLWLLQLLNSKLSHRYQPFNIRVLHLFFIVVLVVLFFMILPATIFAIIEPQWDFLDSFYYCFISLTTIGLGDYIPGDNPDQPYRALYKVATTCFLLIGLTFMMLTLAIFYDIPQLNIGLLFKSTGSGDQNSEKARLSSYGYGLQYGMSSTSETKETHMHVVRVRSRQRDDSPSPEEPLTKTEQEQ
ncbi:potassium channel subfamily K member 6-like isoform X2 [Onthophagus taurus]|uniref:potassium channel subfamily K member 6-like isoform X2 n=2 Tax=Onthophagus taurus TaxID=166361 RepID=UPI0039BEABA9